MTTTPTAIVTSELSSYQRLRNFLGTAVFLLIQHYPKLVQFYRNEKSWALFRVALGIFGAALVVLPLGLWNGWLTAIFGLLLFVASILLPPAETESATDRKALELGAQTVVSGGEYQLVEGPSVPAQLFLSPEHVYALDRNFNSLVVIPTLEIKSINVEPSGDNCLLQIRWTGNLAEFSYTGFFAERFARLAEDSIRSFAAPAASPSEAAKRHSAGA
jgi:hypothetical protein